MLIQKIVQNSPKYSVIGTCYKNNKKTPNNLSTNNSKNIIFSMKIPKIVQDSSKFSVIGPCYGDKA